MKAFSNFSRHNYFFLLTFILFLINDATCQQVLSPQNKVFDEFPLKKVIQVLSHDSLYGRSFYRYGKQKALAYLIKTIQTYSDTTVQILKDSFEIPFNQINFIEIDLSGKKLTLGKDYLPTGSVPTFQTAQRVKILDQFTDLSLTKDQKPFIALLHHDYSKETLTTLLHLKPCISIMIETETLYFSPSIEQQNKPILFIKRGIITNKDSLGIQIESKIENYLGENLIVLPKDNNNHLPRITFMTHYDHLGTIQSNFIFNGANDNASGVALAIQLFLSTLKRDLPVQLLLTDAEELGLIGSTILSKSNQVWPIELLINLDMVSSGKNGWGIVGAESDSTVKEQLIAIAQEQQEPILFRKNSPNSDHYPFLIQQVKGFYIYTQNGTQPYHSNLDDESTLDYSALERTASFLNQFLLNYKLR